MTNNANVLYPGVRLNALHAILYFISKVSSIVPILHMRKLNSKKLGYLIKSHAGRTRIQTQIFMTSKQTIPHCLIQKILFKPPLKLWLTTYRGYRDEELLGRNRSGRGTYTGWSLPSKREGGFPGGAVVENLPANAGDTGSSPGLGRSHMPRSN